MRAVAVGIALLGIAGTAQANPVDAFGFGARAASLAGAQTAAWVAIGIAVVLVLQTVLLRRKYPGGLLPNPARAPG